MNAPRRWFSRGRRRAKIPRKRLVAAAAIAVALAAAAGGAFRAMKCGGPVLCAFREPGDVLGEPIFLILNPLRDRGPERAADAFLAVLKSGRPELVIPPLRQSNGAWLLDREGRFRITDRALRNRTGSPDRVRLFYRVVRLESGNDNPLWVDVVKRGDRWQVASLETWY